MRSPAAEIAIRTDAGRDPDKQVNEDSSVYKTTSHGLLAVVCDGMGGHAGGKEASELAIQTIVEIVDAAPPATPPGAALKRAIEEANLRVWQMPTAEAGFRPGSTVVAVLAHEEGAEIAHVGDSRLYLVHAGAISQVTRDHSMVQEMVDRNLIRAEDASKHPDANKILRALGIAKEVEVDLRAEPLLYTSGDILVLCSDGLSDLVEPADILEIAGSHPPAQAAGRLVDLANARGGHDNITAVVVQLKTSAAPRAPGGGPWTGPKTVPLTAHDPMPPIDPNRGRTGTLVAPPAPMPGGPASEPRPYPSPSPSPSPGPGPGPGAVVQPAPSPSGPGSFGIPQIPPAPPSSQGPGSVTGRRNTGIIILGILLAVVALGVFGTLVFVATRPTRRTVVPLIDVRRDAAAADLDAGEAIATATATVIVPAPPLSADKSWRLDGGTGDPCGALRRARDRDAGQATIDRLVAKCLDAGGFP